MNDPIDAPAEATNGISRKSTKSFFLPYYANSFPQIPK